MKIGILTFHRAHNYGAVLQTFALQQYLCELGHDPYVIDYNPNYISRGYRWFSIKYWLSPKPMALIKRLRREPFIVAKRKKRFDAFNCFISSNLRLYPYKKSEDFSGFDCVIVGSDQIWEPAITDGKLDPVMFAFNARCKVISYAASSKLTELKGELKSDFGNYLSHLSAISVREKVLQLLLQPICKIPVQCVVDPTFLIESKIYKKLSHKPTLDYNYVCVYEISPHSEVRTIAATLATQLRARVVEISSFVRYTNDKSIIMTASVEEFLGLLINAKCVVTTSFHGTALSIINKVDFYAVKVNSKSDERLQNILEQIGLMDRFIDMDSVPEFSHVNYENSEIKMSQLINKSKQYLRSVLNE